MKIVKKGTGKRRKIVQKTGGKALKCTFLGFKLQKFAGWGKGKRRKIDIRGRVSSAPSGERKKEENCIKNC